MSASLSPKKIRIVKFVSFFVYEFFGRELRRTSHTKKNAKDDEIIVRRETRRVVFVFATFPKKPRYQLD